MRWKRNILPLQLRKVPFVSFFPDLFFPYSWKGQWNNRPLGSFDMNSPLEALVQIRPAAKIPLGLKFALCLSTNIIHFSIAGPLTRLWWSEIPARWLDLLLYHCTTQVIPFTTAAATKISRSYSKRLAGNLPWTRVKFPVERVPN